MIYITGDTHGEQNRLLYIEQETGIKAGDTLIICGDFGYLFLNNTSERLFLDDVERTRPYTIAFVDGNHENFPAIYEFPIEDWNGGKVHRIRKNIVHLMRGQVFTIEGKTFFSMGGAYSIDKYMRTEGYSWWSEELPCDAEYKEAVANLKKYDNKVDYVISHTAPQSIIHWMGYVPDSHDQELTGFFAWIYHDISFKYWYFGHWHNDNIINDKARLLWFDVVKIQGE